MLDDVLSRLKVVKDSVVDGTGTLIDDASRIIDRASKKNICVGVTGFSGSGKSTFITSLLHQLRYSNEAGISGFQLARDERILEVNLLPLAGCELFDYEQGITALASQPPKWPMPTGGLTGCVIQIIYKRDSVASSVIGDSSTFNIEVRDYPGEWLLDLPLRDINYWTWSLENIELIQQAPRKIIMGDLLQQLQSINPFEILSEDRIDSLFKQYSEYLKECKQQGLTLIQPGRVLLPDPNQPVAPFFPLLRLRQYDQAALAGASEQSIYKVMLSRYDLYVSDIVEPFYDDYFNKIDRQVVMVDVLKGLSGGELNFDDMMVALSRIMDCYRHGTNNLFEKLMSPKVERILFLASKPDRVLASQHENLRSLVNDIIVRVCSQKLRNLIHFDTEAACAVRCTDEKHEKLRVTAEDGERGVITPPDIPEHIPTHDEWLEMKVWQPVILRPPFVPGLQQGARLPSIRMDNVLKYLIGDKF